MLTIELLITMIKVIFLIPLGDFMGWLGLDDTDHLGGGCTTKSLDDLIIGLPKNVSVGEIRLVRLWPFAKQRTRGNAAVAVELNSENEKLLIEHLDYWWNEKIEPLSGSITNSENYDREQYATDPGMVWFSKSRPAEKFYFDAVSKEVQLSLIPDADKSWGGHGRIGATAAVAWNKSNITYEAIAWRCQNNISNDNIREIDLDRLKEIDTKKDTFMSRDSRTGNSLIAPRGPCPVLFGVRATVFESAEKSAQYLIDSDKTEPVSGMRVFVTNQASDDHLGDNLNEIIVETQILSRGTVIIKCLNHNLVAFSESGDIKLLAQWLKKGDEIQFNGLSSNDGSIHLERLKIIKSEPNKVRPICDKCNVRMKSMGQNQPVRCPKCRYKSEILWIDEPRIPPFTTWVQAPLDSRRHLTRPLEWCDFQ